MYCRVHLCLCASAYVVERTTRKIPRAHNTCRNTCKTHVHELIDHAIHLRAHTHTHTRARSHGVNARSSVSHVYTTQLRSPHSVNTKHSHTRLGHFPPWHGAAGTVSCWDHLSLCNDKSSSRFTPTLTVVSCHDAIRTLHAVPQRQSQPIGSAGALNELKYSHCLCQQCTEDRLASSVV